MFCSRPRKNSFRFCHFHSRQVQIFSDVNPFCSARARQKVRFLDFVLPPSATTQKTRPSFLAIFTSEQPKYLSGKPFFLSTISTTKFPSFGT